MKLSSCLTTKRGASGTEIDQALLVETAFDLIQKRLLASSKALGNWMFLLYTVGTRTIASEWLHHSHHL